ncbi:MAG: hypothetical protein GY853_01255 [PVC group bacterium]|nr:hypothetical protein [PVC group bacterium]
MTYSRTLTREERDLLKCEVKEYTKKYKYKRLACKIIGHDFTINEKICSRCDYHKTDVYYFEYKVRFEMKNGSRCTKKMGCFRNKEIDAEKWLLSRMNTENYFHLYSRRKTVATKRIKRFGYKYIGKRKGWNGRNIKPEVKHKMKWSTSDQLFNEKVKG